MFAFGLDHFVCLHFGPKKKKLHLCYDKKKIGFGDDEFNDPSLQLCLWIVCTLDLSFWTKKCTFVLWQKKWLRTKIRLVQLKEKKRKNNKKIERTKAAQVGPTWEGMQPSPLDPRGVNNTLQKYLQHLTRVSVLDPEWTTHWNVCRGWIVTNPTTYCYPWIRLSHICQSYVFLCTIYKLSWLK